MSDIATVEVPADDHSIRRKSPNRRRRYFKFLLAIAGVVFLIFGGIAADHFLRAASLMYGMTYAGPPLILKAYSRVFRHPTVTRDLWIQGSRGPLQLRIMGPADVGNPPILVLVHGFAVNGVHDGLLNAFAQRLSRNGLKVVMPDITSEKLLRIDRTAVEDVDDAIRWSAQASGQKVSVLGVSFSGGLVISAAANPSVANDVKTTLCVSGYNSIPRVGRFYLREPLRGPDSRPYVEEPVPDALALIALQYLDELVSPKQMAPMEAALGAILRGRGSVAPSDLTNLTTSQRMLLDDLLNVRTHEMRVRYEAVLDRHQAEWDYISPKGKINQLRGSLYVLHGRSDGRIPVEEAEWTKAEAKDNREVKTLISPWINHSMLVPHTPLREKLRVLYFASQMLDEAFHPVPLGGSNN